MLLELFRLGKIPTLDILTDRFYETPYAEGHQGNVRGSERNNPSLPSR